MTPIQRTACLTISGLAYGRATGDRNFARAMVRLAAGEGWESIELTTRQLQRLARHHRRYRRQVRSPNLLFWAQRVLAEAVSSVPTQEESCPQ